MLSRLKSLELHGYKTFASRTLFEFPGDITAIVGPNGSGKSNIADALRWVLGEQSYSLLRGRKTEDMIFSGSEQRPRASMASASITFDNEDGWLPIDYSEVLLARRAYRDGQNEYVLNGQRVRLKEISELLAQSGLAERTYTVIGQGLVDAALALKPEERRKFFEEAAGIGLYRSRRDEAINRLDTTRRNLERVLDIIGELEPRLKSLERQAARAIEYDRIKADLQLLLRDWYGFHWHRLQGDVTHAREVLQVQEQKLAQAQSKYDEVESRVKELRDQLSILRTRLNGWHAQSAELHSAREKVNRTLAVLEERQRSLTDQQAALQVDLARVEEEEHLHSERLNRMTVERQEMQAESDESDSQLQKVRAALSERESSRASLDKNLREVRRQLVAVETRQVEVKAHLSELKNRLETLRRNQENTQQTLAPAQKAVEAARLKLESVKNDQELAENSRKALETELREAQSLASEAETQRRQAADRLAKISTERSHAAAQLEVLEQAERNLSGLNQGAKTVLQAAREGHLTGQYHSLAQLMEVPHQYESAIAAVLGESLEGISLTGPSDPDKVFELLASGEKGRATLFPVEWLRMESVLRAPKDADCLGVASQLVTVQDGSQAVVDLLLGQVLIARDRKSARRMAAAQPIHVRVVTLQGEVFSGSGAVTAGQVNRSAVLSRPRQLREAKDALGAIDLLFSKADEAAKTAVQILEQARSSLQIKERSLRDAEQQVRSTVRALQQATLEFEQARQKQQFQQGQLTSLGEQIKKGETERSEQKLLLEKAENDAESLDLEVRDLQRSLDLLPLEEYQQQVVHWNTQTALAARGIKEADRRLEEYRQALQINQSQQRALHSRMEQVDQAVAAHAAEKNQQIALETDLNGQIESLLKQIEPDEHELTALETRYEQLQGDLTAAQQAMSVAERYSTQAQLESGRLRDSLDTLRHRIEEDFGLVALEYSAEIAGPTPLPLEGMVQQLPKVAQIPAELEVSINRQRNQLRRMGAINPEARAEYQDVKERHTFLTGQVTDLHKADEDLRQVIAELDELMKTEFRKTFKAVAAEFTVLFTRLFGGGTAKLVMQDEENPTEGGIDIEARLPGRREQGLALLSGGERSLTAVALIFSLLKVSPTPFCVLDEVDAMLDEANVGRFTDLLRELSQATQFIVITHNRNTVQVADVIYGVTMGKDSASQVISLKLDEVPEELVRAR